MFQQVVAVGNLGKDPEMRFTPSGQGVCRFPLAVNERWTDREGQPQERAEWFNVVVWGKMGEACAQYLAKGRAALVVGTMRTRTWEKDGEKKYATDLIAQRVQFLSSGQKDRAAEGAAQAPAGSAPPEDDDIPF